MDIERRAVLAAGGAAAILGAAGTAEAETMSPPANPWAGFIAPDGQSIKAVQVSVGSDGQSTIREIDLTADKSVAPKLFQQFLTHKASKVAIYRAPPRHAIAGTAPAKDLLFIVDGETTLKIEGGNRKVGRGTFVLFDGMAKHAEEAGPAGYTALKVRLAD